MKAIFALISLAVLIAGAYFGIEDYNAYRANRETRRGGDLGRDDASVAEATIPSQSSKSAQTPVETVEVVDKPSLDREALETSVENALKSYRKSTARERFAEASKRVTAALGLLVREHEAGLRSDPDGVELLQPLRLAVHRARLFDELRRIEKIEDLPEAFYKVQLANGNALTARRAELSGGRYEIELFPHAIVFSKPRSEIAAVTRLERQAYLESEWARVSAKLKKEATDPIDLYVKGVGRCMKLGLLKEAFGVLVDVLDTPGSGDVLEVVFLQSDPTFKKLWRQSSGKEPFDDLPGLAPPRPREVATSKQPVTAMEEPTELVRPPRQPTGDLSSLKEIDELERAARQIYRRAISGSGDRNELAVARRKLERARDLLRPLPRDDGGVQRLKARVFDLLYAVIKDQPF